MYASYANGEKNGGISVGKVISVKAGETDEGEPILVATMIAPDGGYVTADRTQLLAFDSDEAIAKRLSTMVDPGVAIRQLVSSLRGVGDDAMADHIQSAWDEQQREAHADQN